MKKQFYFIKANLYKDDKLIKTIECRNSGINSDDAISKANYLHRGKGQVFKVISVEIIKHLDKNFRCAICGGFPDYAEVDGYYDIYVLNYCMDCRKTYPECKKNLTWLPYVVLLTVIVSVVFMVI